MNSDNMEGNGISELSLRKNDMAAVYYANLSPCLSRFYMEHCNALKRQLSVKETSPEMCCQFCHTLFNSKNHIVRFKSRMQEKSITRVMKKVKCRGLTSLGKFEKHLYDLYSKTSAQTIITCFVCKRKTHVQRFGKPKRPRKFENKELAPVKSYKEKRKEKKKLKRKLGAESDQGASSTQLIGKLNERSGQMNQNLKANARYSPSTLGLQCPMSDQDQSLKSSKKSKSKKRQNVLQTMLAKAKKEKDRAGSGGLHDFLSNI